MGNACSIKHHLLIKAYLVLGFFYLFCPMAKGQDQRFADSLEVVYKTGNFLEQDRLKILHQLVTSFENPERKLNYSYELIERAQRLDSNQYLFDGYLQKGTALRLKSDLTEALKSYFEAAKIAVEAKVNRDLGFVDIAIADVYSIMGNHNNAVKYYHDAIDILREENDLKSYASALENLGDEYLISDKPDSALIIFEESGKIFRELNYEMGIAYNRGNMGIAYAMQ